MEATIYKQENENSMCPHWLDGGLRPYFGVLSGKSQDEIVEFFDSFNAKPLSNTPDKSTRSDRRRSSIILVQLVRKGIFEYVGDHPKMYKCEHGTLSRTEALMDARRLHGSYYKRAYAFAEGK